MANSLGIETDEGQEFFHARGDAVGIPFFQCGHQADVFGDGEMGEKSGFLNNVADAAAQANGIPLGGGAALDEHLPTGGQQQAINQP